MLIFSVVFGFVVTKSPSGLIFVYNFPSRMLPKNGKVDVIYCLLVVEVLGELEKGGRRVERDGTREKV